MIPILQGWLKQNLMLKYLQLLEVVHGMHQLDIPVCSLKPLVVAVGLVALSVISQEQVAVELALEAGLELKLLELL
jgi:hypothetical protein